ncbi:hypothetical protein PR048_001096 [Dryococelus australis]|uniref:Uncharacterized protein n=1 Tax=Dryococelus australis TaxID=614101 RepID=A0ABQ9IGE0_9NEOP|nr:hypothetical protein PR048_001096 [Dryococelus australis]
MDPRGAGREAAPGVITASTRRISVAHELGVDRRDPPTRTQHEAQSVRVYRSQTGFLYLLFPGKKVVVITKEKRTSESEYVVKSAASFTMKQKSAGEVQIFRWLQARELFKIVISLSGLTPGFIAHLPCPFKQPSEQRSLLPQPRHELRTACEANPPNFSKKCDPLLISAECSGLNIPHAHNFRCADSNITPWTLLRTTLFRLNGSTNAACFSSCVQLKSRVGAVVSCLSGICDSGITCIGLRHPSRFIDCCLTRTNTILTRHRPTPSFRTQAVKHGAWAVDTCCVITDISVCCVSLGRRCSWKAGRSGAAWNAVWGRGIRVTLGTGLYNLLRRCRGVPPPPPHFSVRGYLDDRHDQVTSAAEISTSSPLRCQRLVSELETHLRWPPGYAAELRAELQQKTFGATVSERLARSPPTKANRFQSPAGSPDFRKWESCRTMPLVGGFSRGSPFSPDSSFRRRSIFTSITLIGSQDLAKTALLGFGFWRTAGEGCNPCPTLQRHSSPTILQDVAGSHQAWPLYTDSWECRPEDGTSFAQVGVEQLRNEDRVGNWRTPRKKKPSPQSAATPADRPNSRNKISINPHVLQSEPLNAVAWKQRGPGYVPGESPSTRFLYDSTKHQQRFLEIRDEQVAGQPYSRHVRWAICQAKVLARELDVPVVRLKA